MSKNRPRVSGPRKFEREQRDVERNRPGTDFEEFPKQGSEVEGDGVVEERLADEQGEPENRALRVFRERGGGDLAEVDPFARANRDRLLGLLELLPGALPHFLLDFTDDRLGLVLVAVDEQPPRALRHMAADDQDPDPQHGADPEREAPAEVGREQGRVEQRHRKQRADPAPTQ